MNVFIIYICIDWLAWSGLLSPGVGHKWRVQAELQALSKLQPQTKQTGDTDDELIFYLKVNILIFFLNWQVFKMSNILFASLYLVLHGDFWGQSIVSVPFLAEVEAQLVHLVLGLQVTSRLSRVSVVGAGGGELLQDKAGWSDEGGDGDGKWSGKGSRKAHWGVKARLHKLVAEGARKHTGRKKKDKKNNLA